ncbi:olfactory receptor 5AC2-like [Dendropsophus ebraccatus]|uniref:olfactory receptor 5AC2-like n=1 Tax=Dendropsophus ebraccatus TaxID=150705 RepID=UPI003831CB6F
MDNVSMTFNVQDFVLLGLKEMKQLRYFYSVVALLIYLSTISLCTLIVFVVWTEQSLHEPMYIFICGLMGNLNIASSAVIPKLAIDLLSGCTTISLSGCLIQSYCLQSSALVEILTFTIMAYDRYLAVGFPLRYHSLMTNRKALQSLAIIWSVNLILVFVVVLLVIRLTLCGNSINGVLCETMSLTRMSCGSTVINDIYGTIYTLLCYIGSLMIVIYCYIRTFLVCLKISKEAAQKAIHTLVTHIITYSTFMATTSFLILRAEALRMKMIKTLKEIIHQETLGKYKYHYAFGPKKPVRNSLVPQSRYVEESETIENPHCLVNSAFTSLISDHPAKAEFVKV